MKTNKTEQDEMNVRTVENALNTGRIPHTNVWKFRGRIFATIPKEYFNNVEAGFFVSKVLGEWLIIASKWISSEAEIKQLQAGNLTKDERMEIKALQQAHYERLLEASMGEIELIHEESFRSADEYDEAIDKLDEHKVSLRESEGYVGYYYKEDFDLERAGRLESQIRH